MFVFLLDLVIPAVRQQMGPVGSCQCIAPAVIQCVIDRPVGAPGLVRTVTEKLKIDFFLIILNLEELSGGTFFPML